MKKFINIFLCFILIFLLSACSSNTTETESTTEEETTTEEQIVGIANPITELTKEEFEEEFGAAWVPEESENILYSKITFSSEDTSDLAEIEFTRFDNEYCFRFKKGEEQDISGMYYSWTYDVEDDKLNDDSKYSCHIMINEDEGVGVASWYDSNRNTNFSISMTEGATRELLLSTFEGYYRFYCETIGE